MGRDLRTSSHRALSLSKEESETWKEESRSRPGRKTQGSILHISISIPPPTCACWEQPLSLPWPPSCHLYFLQAKPWAKGHTDFKNPIAFPQRKNILLEWHRKARKRKLYCCCFPPNASWFPVDYGNVSRCFSSSSFWRITHCDHLWALSHGDAPLWVVFYPLLITEGGQTVAQERCGLETWVSSATSCSVTLVSHPTSLKFILFDKMEIIIPTS